MAVPLSFLEQCHLVQVERLRWVGCGLIDASDDQENSTEGDHPRDEADKEGTHSFTFVI